MRSTIIESVEENWRMDLGSDAVLVATVLEMGNAIDYLVYEARLTGKEVLQLLSKTRYPHALDDTLVMEHHYVVRAYDD